MTFVNIQENYSLRHLISFKTGGEARFFVEIESLEQLIEIKKKAVQQELPFFLLGRGTNVVVSDKGFNGYVAHLARSFSDLSIEETILKAKAGTPLSRIARYSVQESLKGIHLLTGVPGTLGGAVYMNAGAYGQEISQTIVEVKSLNEEGQIICRTAAECEFSYRHSIFQENKECIFEVTLQLEEGEQEVLEKEMKAAIQKRIESQPLNYPSAGSVFKKPAEGSAWALIEEAGLKGTSIGGASVSSKHGNFIVNKNNASAQDIYDLSNLVIETVLKKSGVKLEREIIFLGNF